MSELFKGNEYLKPMDRVAFVFTSSPNRHDTMKLISRSHYAARVYDEAIALLGNNRLEALIGLASDKETRPKVTQDVLYDLGLLYHYLYNPSDESIADNVRPVITFGQDLASEIAALIAAQTVSFEDGIKIAKTADDILLAKTPFAKSAFTGSLARIPFLDDSQVSVIPSATAKPTSYGTELRSALTHLIENGTHSNLEQQVNAANNFDIGVNRFVVFGPKGEEPVGQKIMGFGERNKTYEIDSLESTIRFSREKVYRNLNPKLKRIEQSAHYQPRTL